MKSILVTGGAGFIGSNLALELQSRYPDAWITVIDDFRSGSFKTLEGFKGDIVAGDMSRLDFKDRFKEPEWDAVFHMASITDTTEHDQLLQVHDNVESFRKLLEFTRDAQTPIVYASSAATYGIAAGINWIEQAPAPANVYAFSKVQLDNLADRYVSQHSLWKIVGLKFFNVYGPREAHKLKAASMIYQLAQQMLEGKRPKIFKMGEQKRDFIYVKDIVNYVIKALDAKHATLLNAGSGEARSFNDIITTLNDVLGTDLETEYMDNPFPFYQPHTEADLTKTEAELGWKAEFSLEAGIKDYYESGYLTKGL